MAFAFCSGLMVAVSSGWIGFLARFSDASVQFGIDDHKTENMSTKKGRMDNAKATVYHWSEVQRSLRGHS
jgi:hypothetical protein